jgi:hypothetical protein
MDIIIRMDSKFTDIFWTQEVHTIVHIQNRGMLKNNSEKNPYELWKRKTSECEAFHNVWKKMLH